jgi:hypothetical protein
MFNTTLRRRNSNRLRKYYFSGFATLLPFYFALVVTLTFSHNSTVAYETQGRNFEYDSWQIITKNSKDFFGEVKNGDFFISRNQNDAFESNAGSFYFNTGIRLSYLFKTSIIYPEIDDCAIANGCNLESIRERVIKTFPNLKRGDLVPKSTRTSRSDDWINTSINAGFPQAKQIWAFDMYLMTPKTYFVYLVPFLETDSGAFVDLDRLKSITVTNGTSEEFIPAMSGLCLNRGGNSYFRGGFLISEWKVSEPFINPAGEFIQPRGAIDMRELSSGSCAKP